MRLRPMNMAAQPAALRPHVFSELLFCSRRNTSCRTSREGRWSQPTEESHAAPPAGAGLDAPLCALSSGCGWGLTLFRMGCRSPWGRPLSLTWSCTAHPSPQLTPSSPPALHRATRRPGPGKGARGCDMTDPPALHLGLSKDVARHPLPKEAPVTTSVTSEHLGGSGGFSALLTAPSLGGQPGRTHKDPSPLPLPSPASRPWLCHRGGRLVTRALKRGAQAHRGCSPLPRSPHGAGEAGCPPTWWSRGPAGRPAAGQSR